MEEECWGVLTKQKIEHFLFLFTKQFGKPIHSKRLSFSFWDHKRNEIDTRIRITDGKAEIMQKIGKWEKTHKWVRSEQRVRLSADSQEIFNAYKILRALFPEENVCHIMQYDNYIFKQDKFEIKLTHQSGKTDNYNFEVEANNKDMDLDGLLEDLGLSKLMTITSVEFWDKWNEQLNLKDTDLSNEQIGDLIKKYLTLV
ncbi:hypothetical protein A2V80_00475 [Candidatus Woesebacteria bacterium RBG_16_39_8b]|uniref:CYTH domain-containing protein n=1 Tax=Candidatus Woesebacteria bacterium RBG_16_39_8b TaxID=1802482 RepID=A0A1F7XDP0_9BACT|nr:MAG: hypothetical protein A2V80_00475 [Candidatus Woesebacteria bacterium RBG_16_39_8b]